MLIQHPNDPPISIDDTLSASATIRHLGRIMLRDGSFGIQLLVGSWHKLCRTSSVPRIESLPLLPAREIPSFARHNSSRMHDVEENRGNQHREGIQAILVCFMIRNRTIKTAGELDESENNANLDVREV